MKNYILNIFKMNFNLPFVLASTLSWGLIQSHVMDWLNIEYDLFFKVYICIWVVGFIIASCYIDHKFTLETN